MNISSELVKIARELLAGDHDLHIALVGALNRINGVKASFGSGVKGITPFMIDLYTDEAEAQVSVNYKGDKYLIELEVKADKTYRDKLKFRTNSRMTIKDIVRGISETIKKRLKNERLFDNGQ